MEILAIKNLIVKKFRINCLIYRVSSMMYYDRDSDDLQISLIFRARLCSVSSLSRPALFRARIFVAGQRFVLGDLYTPITVSCNPRT